MPHADLYYHATPESSLDGIRENGLVPSPSWACLGPDPDPEEAADLSRVFLCDSLPGAERYRAMLARHEPAVILAIRAPALTDVERDPGTRGDCYVTHAVPSDEIEVMAPDGGREPLVQAAPAP